MKTIDLTRYVVYRVMDGDKVILARFTHREEAAGHADHRNKFAPAGVKFAVEEITPDYFSVAKS